MPDSSRFVAPGAIRAFEFGPVDGEEALAWVMDIDALVKGFLEAALVGALGEALVELLTGAFWYLGTPMNKNKMEPMLSQKQLDFRNTFDGFHVKIVLGEMYPTLSYGLSPIQGDHVSE
ncbi:hypothetical protein K493DRAFT_298209 [Basidiobolus meristosporus CBS 931.73]|uniref:Uncharacterized protein n=1 Tax=Basidiobolus meristosporus CBS 931.73 TaxID=1314790 RepID=A0A1Y1YUX6_9FUNG|nr:hypothetical protein K493DRAFT_298209 [Basidiobolus meristosporus CBS 931.73]|eukprot:ORY01766.1 hypothetical protein K493DRAFT_298209 [Basidiobolus meristosporus CBS 931.73]